MAIYNEQEDPNVLDLYRSTKKGKKAIMVEYCFKTRIIIDEEKEDVHNVVELSRHKIIDKINNNEFAENVEWYDDEEMPYEEGEEISERLEYLRTELRSEHISSAELAELQSLTGHIEDGDVELLEAAGVEEKVQLSISTLQIITGMGSKNNGEWVCTDPANNQYGRRVTTYVYEFKQETTYPDGEVYESQDIINLLDYSGDQIDECLSSYGYTKQGLIDSCGMLEAYWIIAECLFESEN